jgi:hypothetical protein
MAMTRVLALAAVAVLITWGTASADETVSTATPADAHPPGAALAGAQAATPTSINDPNNRPHEGGGVRMTACGPEGVDSAGVTETRPHGEISVGAGTHGYREVGGSVCQPLPNGGFVAISGGQSQVRWGH